MGLAVTSWELVVVLGQVGPVPVAGSPIGVAELEAARALLAQAQAQLRPEQFELLERELIEAEGAFQRYSALARASGEAAEVVRGAEALAGARRATQIADGLGTVSRVGPMLVALALLWPRTSIATQSEELPPRQVAQRDLEAALQRVATDSRRMGEEIEAARRSRAQPASSKAAGAASQKAGSGQPPGDPPCYHVGTTGSGAYRPQGAPASLLKCWYSCGTAKPFSLDVWGHSDADCKRPELFERARREAERRRQQDQGH